MTTKEFQDFIVNSTSSYKFLGSDDGYWLGANGNIRISDMDDGYRKNCINYLNKHRENIRRGFFLEGMDKSEYCMADYDELVRHACEALARKIKELSQNDSYNLIAGSGIDVNPDELNLISKKNAIRVHDLFKRYNTSISYEDADTLWCNYSQDIHAVSIAQFPEDIIENNELEAAKLFTSLYLYNAKMVSCYDMVDEVDYVVERIMAKQ